MTDQPDIVARLRAYTQHNRPVLASDLKEAADKIGWLTTIIEQHQRLLRHLFEGVHEAVGSTAVPPINTQTAVELVGKVHELHHEFKRLQRQLQQRSELLVGFARDVSEAAGRACWPNDVYDKSDLQHLVDDVAALRRDRDALMPVDLPEDATEAPTVTPRTDRFDEFERRLALLESSHCVTRRRLVQAGETLALDNNTAGISEVSKILRGFRDA